jgi:glyoxylase-like metal-dependent hydrolase (beta-lactamase superfamily II)
MKILTKTGGLAATNCYLVADEATGKAVIFDAPNGTTTPLLNEAEKRGWDVVGLWLTHGHWDHIADHAVVTQRFPNAKVLIHTLDEPKLQNPKSMMFPLPFVIPPRSADAHVEEGQTLRVGNLEATVIHTPGHAPGHVMYHFAKQKTLIGGDLIIGGSIGRYDFPDCSFADLASSIRRVMRLPDDTQLYGGHGPPTSLGEERQHNDAVREILENATN